MKLESVGILINMRPIGERDSIARIFTPDFGVICGVMRAAQIAKKNRPLVGQFGTMTWNARLDTQLGTFHWESEKNMASALMTNPRALGMMNSAFALVSTLLPEREQYAGMYNATIDLMNTLPTQNNVQTYLDWETKLLREMGYGLNLSACSGCGTHENLEYISPRTGRAVCATCGAPYAPRLYKMPLNLDITRKFIEHICMSQGAEIPLARRMLSGMQ